jgi:uncharacterized membrane protein YadS
VSGDCHVNQLFIGKLWWPPVALCLADWFITSFLDLQDTVRPGIDFCAKTILRLGVAFSGIRITFSDISAIGVNTGLMVICAVVATVTLGFLLAKLLKLSPDFGLIAGGSVGICGASAALAVASVLPEVERE